MATTRPRKSKHAEAHSHAVQVAGMREAQRAGTTATSATGKNRASTQTGTASAATSTSTSTATQMVEGTRATGVGKGGDSVLAVGHSDERAGALVAAASIRDHAA
jgi:ethanolamine ammonia-lyase large subunit